MSSPGGPIHPDDIPVVHSHANPETGATAFSSSWPCPQCIALGRTKPLRYGRDVPDYTSVSSAEVPPERLEAYLASFDAPDRGSAPSPAGSHRDRRKAAQGRASGQAQGPVKGVADGSGRVVPLACRRGVVGSHRQLGHLREHVGQLLPDRHPPARHRVDRPGGPARRAHARGQPAVGGGPGRLLSAALQAGECPSPAWWRCTRGRPRGRALRRSRRSPECGPGGRGVPPGGAVCRRPTCRPGHAARAAQGTSSLLAGCGRTFASRIPRAVVNCGRWPQLAPTPKEPAATGTVVTWVSEPPAPTR